MARLNHVKSFRGTSKTQDGNLCCSKCGATITKGDSYRWWANRAPGMRGGIKRIRCMKSECTPTIAEMTPGRRGQWYGMQEGFEQELAACATIDDVQATAESIASEVESFGQEFIEGADNMESGFGHETEQSMDLRQKGEDIEQAAAEIRDVDIDDFDEDAVREELTTDFPEEAEDEDWLKSEIAQRLEEAVEEARNRVQEKIDEVDF